MNFKIIINLIPIIFIFLIISCSNIDLLKNKSVPSNDYKIDEFEQLDKFSNYQIFKTNFEDYYTRNTNFIWKESKKLNKFFEFNVGNDKKIDSNISNFISDDEFVYFINEKLEFTKISIIDGDINSKITLNVENKSDFILPISIAKIQNYFFGAFSNGLIFKFDKKGKIIWQKKFNDLLRTPIKINNNNLIIIFNSNNILSLNSQDGSTNWNYNYLLDKSSSKSTGAQILINNNLLYFVMPNGIIGSIDTLIGEKNNLIYMDKIKQGNILSNNYEAKIGYSENIFSFIEEKERLYSYNLKTEEFSLFNSKIHSIKSYDFINNALIVLDDDHLLKAYNLINKKLFWKIDISNILSKKENIVQTFVFNDQLIVFFSEGNILQLDLYNGNISFAQKLKIKKIAFISSFNNILSFTLNNGKTIFYNQ